MIHITCNMGSQGLPDNVCPWALGIHIRQIPPAHVTTIATCGFQVTCLDCRIKSQLLGSCNINTNICLFL